MGLVEIDVADRKLAHFCATDWERFMISGSREKALSRASEKFLAIVLWRRRSQ